MDFDLFDKRKEDLFLAEIKEAINKLSEKYQMTVDLEEVFEDEDFEDDLDLEGDEHVLLDFNFRSNSDSKNFSIGNEEKKEYLTCDEQLEELIESINNIELNIDEIDEDKMIYDIKKDQIGILNGIFKELANQEENLSSFNQSFTKDSSEVKRDSSFVLNKSVKDLDLTSRAAELLLGSQTKEFVCYDKTMLIAYRLPNGSVINTQYTSVDPSCFKLEEARRYCREQAINQIKQLEAYFLLALAYDG